MAHVRRGAAPSLGHQGPTGGVFSADAGGADLGLLDAGWSPAERGKWAKTWQVESKATDFDAPKELWRSYSDAAAIGRGVAGVGGVGTGPGGAAASASFSAFLRRQASSDASMPGAGVRTEDDWSVHVDPAAAAAAADMRRSGSGASGNSSSTSNSAVHPLEMIVHSWASLRRVDEAADAMRQLLQAAVPSPVAVQALVKLFVFSGFHERAEAFLLQLDGLSLAIDGDSLGVLLAGLADVARRAAGLASSSSASGASGSSATAISGNSVFDSIVTVYTLAKLRGKLSHYAAARAIEAGAALRRFEFVARVHDDVAHFLGGHNVDSECAYNLALLARGPV